MSLGIVFKGPEGIVLAADSRVTLTMERQGPKGQKILLPSTFDNATKLLRVSGQDFVGVVTYGLGAIGEKEPRTVHSYLPEFEEWIRTNDVDTRLSVSKFCEKMGTFFVAKWNASMKAGYTGDDIILMIGGYNPGEPYGRIFEMRIPSAPTPTEMLADTFGAVWGGQREVTDRILHGYDAALLSVAKGVLELDDARTGALRDGLRNLAISIPYQFLPLQDSVDLSIFLVRATITFQKWQVGIRGVGGAIDAATVTPRDGFKYVQQKTIRGESESKG